MLWRVAARFVVPMMPNSKLHGVLWCMSVSLQYEKFNVVYSRMYIHHHIAKGGFCRLFLPMVYEGRKRWVFTHQSCRTLASSPNFGDFQIGRWQCVSDLMQHTIVLAVLLYTSLSFVQLTVALIPTSIDKSMVTYPQLLKRSGLQARQWMRTKALPFATSYHVGTARPLFGTIHMGHRSFRMGALRMKPVGNHEFESHAESNVNLPDLFNHHEYASEEINLDHILSTSTQISQIHPYWIEQLKLLDRPAAKSLIPKLLPSNPLGYELASGVAKKGSLMENMIQWKRQHVDKVILTRVGEFYETTGVDALMLVNYAGLNPMGGGVRAGCPIKNIQATLDSLTQVLMCFAFCKYWFSFHDLSVVETLPGFANDVCVSLCYIQALSLFWKCIKWLMFHRQDWVWQCMKKSLKLILAVAAPARYISVLFDVFCSSLCFLLYRFLLS